MENFVLEVLRSPDAIQDVLTFYRFTLGEAIARLALYADEVALTESHPAVQALEVLCQK